MLPNEPSEGGVLPLRSESPDAVERRVLAYASAVGREVDFPLLVDAMEVDEESLIEALERLVARGIFRELSGGDRFAFADELERVHLYRALSQSRLRIIHRKVAEAMERRHHPVPPEIVQELGRHFFLGRVPEKSFAYNLEAADRAERAGATDQAALFLERVRLDRASVSGLDPGTEGHLAERLGRIYYALGDLRAAARLFAEGLESTPPGDSGRLAELWIARAQVARDLRDTEGAVAGARQAEALYERIDDTAGLAVVHRTLSRLSFDRGRYREALEEGMVALELLQQTDDDSTVGRLSVELGNAFQRLDPALFEEAVAWYDRAIPRLTRAEDVSGLSEAYRERGRTLRDHRPEEALDNLARSRTEAEKAHDPLAEASALLESVPVRIALGQIDEAERDNQLAERVLEERQAPEALERARLNSGMLKERRGQWEDAERVYLDAVERARRLQDEGAIAEAAFALARLYAKTRDLPKARSAYSEAAERGLSIRRPSLAPAFEDLGRELEGGAEAGAAEGKPPPSGVSG